MDWFYLHSVLHNYNPLSLCSVSIAVSSSKACMKKVERNGEAGDNSLTVFFSTCGKYNACCSPEYQLITEAVIVAPYKEDLAHNSSHVWVSQNYYYVFTQHTLPFHSQSLYYICTHLVVDKLFPSV